MKPLQLFFTVLLIALSAPSYAQAQTIRVDVNGLVCDFCARALEKVFGREDAVDAIDVDLDTKIITIRFKDGKNLDDETITGLITDSGYNVVEIHREEDQNHE